jgi:hypothetical protein
VNHFFDVLRLLRPIIEAAGATFLSGAGERAALDAAHEALADLRSQDKYKDFCPHPGPERNT